jgi:vancomycin permeability regulator SanA
MKIRFGGDKKVFLFAIGACFLAAAMVAGGMVFAVQSTGNNFICSTDNVPEKQVILVLGAKVHENGQMSDMFRDRVDAAIALYESKKSGKILVSGDHGQKNYDEVDAAKEYLLRRGVKSEDIFLDHAGFDTYDSVYRAKKIFQVESLIVSTQRYHLPRALYISRKLGIDAVGVPADLHEYGGQDYRNLREWAADVKAWLDVNLKARPRFLGEAIPITGNSYASWDENKQ